MIERIIRDSFKFCVNMKTDIRLANSCEWAGPILPGSGEYPNTAHFRHVNKTCLECGDYTKLRDTTPILLSR